MLEWKDRDYINWNEIQFPLFIVCISGKGDEKKKLLKKEKENENAILLLKGLYDKRLR